MYVHVLLLISPQILTVNFPVQRHCGDEGDVKTFLRVENRTGNGEKDGAYRLWIWKASMIGRKAMQKTKNASFLSAN